MELLLQNFSSHSVLVPTERRFDITAFFKSFSSEILERFFPLGNPVVKLAILLQSQDGSSWRLGSTKPRVHILFAVLCLIAVGQEHYSSIWINDAISTDSAAYFLAIIQMVIISIRTCNYGFAAVIGTWVSISLSISAGDYDHILPWPIWKTRRFSSMLVTNRTPSMPGARLLSPKN